MGATSLTSRSKTIFKSRWWFLVYQNFRNGRASQRVGNPLTWCGTYRYYLSRILFSQEGENWLHPFSLPSCCWTNAATLNNSEAFLLCHTRKKKKKKPRKIVFRRSLSPLPLPIAQHSVCHKKKNKLKLFLHSAIPVPAKSYQVWRLFLFHTCILFSFFSGAYDVSVSACPRTTLTTRTNSATNIVATTTTTTVKKNKV